MNLKEVIRMIACNAIEEQKTIITVAWKTKDKFNLHLEIGLPHLVTEKMCSVKGN